MSKASTFQGDSGFRGDQSSSSALPVFFSDCDFGVNSEAEVMDMLTALPSFSLSSHFPVLSSPPPLFPPPLDKGLSSP